MSALTMAVDITMVRFVALSLPGFTEAICHGAPAFYVRGKLLARLQEDGESLSIGCSRDRREELIEQYPDVFAVTAHFRVYDHILMNLWAANQRLLEVMLEAAWRRKAAKKDVAKFGRHGL